MKSKKEIELRIEYINELLDKTINGQERLKLYSYLNGLLFALED